MRNKSLPNRGEKVALFSIFTQPFNVWFKGRQVACEPVPSQLSVRTAITKSHRPKASVEPVYFHSSQKLKIKVLGFGLSRGHCSWLVDYHLLTESSWVLPLGEC